MAADMYVWQFSASAGLAAEDLFLVVDDPSGSPLYKKATGTQLITLMESSIDDITFANTGLKVYDTGGDHYLTLKVNENLTGNKTLNIVPADDSRTLSLSGDLTVESASLIDQDLTADSTAAAFAVLTLANTGLHLLDTNASHDLIIAPGSDLTADHTVTLTTGDADRTLTLSGNLTVESASLINQDLTTDSATAILATLTLNNTGLHLLDTNASHDLIIAPGSDLTADHTVTLTTGDADRTLTLSGNLTVESASLVNQDLTSDATPTFAGITITPTQEYGSDGSYTAALFTMSGRNVTADEWSYHFGFCVAQGTGTYNIDAGHTDSGYRAGLNLSVYVDDAGFVGGLASQYGVRCEAGINTGTGTVGSAYGFSALIYQTTGAISSAYGLCVTYPGGAGTITNAWGVYATGESKNYFSANVGIGSTSFGTSATKTLAIGSGTAPTTSLTDGVQLYSADAGGVAGHAALHIRSENGGSTAASGIASIECAVGKVNEFRYYAELADDGTYTLPFSITHSAQGWMIAGSNEERAQFTVNATGTVTLTDNSANVSANSDTDTDICIGTAAAQEPLIIKNRLGSAKYIMLIIYYN